MIAFGVLVPSSTVLLFHEGEVVPLYALLPVGKLKTTVEKKPRIFGFCEESDEIRNRNSFKSVERKVDFKWEISTLVALKLKLFEKLFLRNFPNHRRDLIFIECFTD